MTWKKGFTLAEVLITLGIIGVVAAVTIPALVTTYQKRATESQLKKAYSTLVNALRMSENDPDFNYTPPETYGVTLDTHDAYGIFESYFAPYLQGITLLNTKNNNWKGKTLWGIWTCGSLIPILLECGGIFFTYLFYRKVLRLN